MIKPLLMIPGPAWIALFGLLSTWLTQYVSAPWAITASAVLAAVGRGIQFYLEKKKAEENRAPVGTLSSIDLSQVQYESANKKAIRFLFG